MTDSTDPSAAPSPIETEWIETGAIRFEVATCGDPRSDRLALCLHGFPELAYSWRYQMPLLAEHGYRVWAPNQRGYGRTTRPPSVSSYAMEHLVDDVGRLVDASGCSSVTLLGHDWGGAVAWAAALTEVRPLERLIVMNLPHPVRFAEALRHGPQRRRSWYAAFMQIPWLPERLLTARDARAIGEAFRGMAVDKSRFPDSVLDVYRRAALEPGAMKAMINWYRAAFRGRHGELMTRIREPRILETPTLLLWGEEDSALGRELVEGTDELVSDLTVRTLPGVSHWVQQEAPEAVNAMIDAWLDGRPVPEADWGGVLRPAASTEGTADERSRTSRRGRAAEPELGDFLRADLRAPLSTVELVRYADPARDRDAYRVAQARLGGQLRFAARLDSLLAGPGELPFHDVLIHDYPSRWVLLERLEDGSPLGIRPEARQVFCGRPWSRLARTGARLAFGGLRRFGAAAPLPWVTPEQVAETLGRRARDSELEPSAAQIDEFARTPLESPVVMLNLLAYAQQARYERPEPDAQATGRGAYRVYGRGVARLIAQAGGRIRWMTHDEADFATKEPGQPLTPSLPTWDDVVAVEYPSRRAFLAMVASDAYARWSPHREAGLARTSLIATTPWPEFA